MMEGFAILAVCMGAAFLVFVLAVVVWWLGVVWDQQRRRTRRRSW